MTRKILLVLATLVLLAPVAGAQREFHVGVTNREFLKGDASYDWRGAKTHALITTIWYPADAQANEIPQWVGDPAHPFASAGRAALDAKPADSPAKFPLILLSDGSGGSALMMAWLGTELAAHGYIAAAVNHPGNNSLEPYTIQGFSIGWERAVDLSRVLDGMLADPEFGSRIDARRVGAAGFSLGGYTMVVLAGGVGGVADIQYVVAHCSAPNATDPECASPPEFPGLVQKAIELFRNDPAYAAAMKEADTSHRDARIKAVFLIAPYGHLFSTESLKKISIPVEIVAGASDPIAPPAANAEFIAARIPHAKLTIYPGGVAHYTFLGTCSAMGKARSPEFCVDKAGVDRDAVHAETSRKAIAFFQSAFRP